MVQKVLRIFKRTKERKQEALQLHMENIDKMRKENEGGTDENRN